MTHTQTDPNVPVGTQTAIWTQVRLIVMIIQFSSLSLRSLETSLEYLPKERMKAVPPTGIWSEGENYCSDTKRGFIDFCTAT